MSPCSLVLFFPFALPPRFWLSRACLLELLPRPRAWDVRAYLSICGCGRDVCLLACLPVRAAHSLRSFAFSRRPAVWRVVWLRSSASLLACSRRRFGYRVVSYSIPDDTMRITGSCGIRPVVNPACLPRLVCFAACHVLSSLFFLASFLCRCGLLAFIIRSWLLGAVVSVLRAMWAGFLRARPASRSVGRLASRPCLLDVRRRVPRRFAPSSHRSCLIACRLPLRASARASSCFAPSSVPMPSNCFSPPSPPHRHDGRGDTIMPWRLSALLALPLGSPSHPCGSASDGDGVRCLPR